MGGKGRWVVKLFTLTGVVVLTAGITFGAPGETRAVGDPGCINNNPGSSGDVDGDHLNDSCEAAAGGIVGDPDTDDDGVLDGMEYYVGTLVNGGSGYPDGIDTDGDGCTNEQEKGSDPQAGGKRHPGNWWDFYELTGDNNVDLSDTLVTLEHFARDSDASPEAHLVSRLAPQLTYPPGFVVEMDTGIDLGHALLSLQQFGHSCASPPGPAPPNGGGIYD